MINERASKKEALGRAARSKGTSKKPSVSGSRAKRVEVEGKIFRSSKSKKERVVELYKNSSI